MSEETAGAETPAAEPVVIQEPAKVEEQPEATAAQEPEKTEESEKPKREHWAKARIDELTRARREAERQAEYWKQRASKTVDVDSLDYEDGIAERVSQRHRNEQAETAKATAEQLALETFNYRETEARERFADYDAVTRNPNVRITPDMVEVIHDSDVGPDLAYHLGKNPAEAARIAALSPARQAAELGKMEAAITAPKTMPKIPPQPVRPITGSVSGGQQDPAKMSMSEYVAWRKGAS